MGQMTIEDVRKYHRAAKMIELDGTEVYFSCCERYGKDIAGVALVTWLRSQLNEWHEWLTDLLSQRVNQVLQESGRLG